MKKHSVVLITVDCLRADHVGFLGYSRAVTPNLDKLAAGAAVFSNAIVAGAPTYFSVPGILASRHPLSLGRDVLGIAPGEPTLASVLRDAGYATGAFLAGNPYLSRHYGYGHGFDQFRDFLDVDVGEEAVASASEPDRMSRLNRWIQNHVHRNSLTSGGYEELHFWYCQWATARRNVPIDKMRRYPAANVIVDAAQQWLSGLGEHPFFLWLHLMDPHHPYYPPEEALAGLGLSHITARRARFLNSFWNRGDVGPARLKRHRDEIVSLYDAGVYWVDKQISRLVDALKASRRWDDAVIAVTADHGEKFLENGERYHSPTSLPEQLIRVPLVVRAPGLSSRRFEGPFSLIHLAPTLMEAAGVCVPDHFPARGIWDQLVSGSAIAEPAIAECIDGCNNPIRPEERKCSRLMAVRDQELKLVLNFRERQDCLYDLKNDPAERNPLPAGARPRERARLLQIARSHLRPDNDREKAKFRLRALIHELKQSGRLDDRLPEPATTRDADSFA